MREYDFDSHSNSPAPSNVPKIPSRRSDSRECEISRMLSQSPSSQLPIYAVDPLFDMDSSNNTHFIPSLKNQKEQQTQIIKNTQRQKQDQNLPATQKPRIKDTLQYKSLQTKANPFEKGYSLQNSNFPSQETTNLGRYSTGVEVVSSTGNATNRFIPQSSSKGLTSSTVEVTPIARPPRINPSQFKMNNHQMMLSPRKSNTLFTQAQCQASGRVNTKIGEIGQMGGFGQVEYKLQHNFEKFSTQKLEANIKNQLIDINEDVQPTAGKILIKKRIESWEISESDSFVEDTSSDLELLQSEHKSQDDETQYKADSSSKQIKSYHKSQIHIEIDESSDSSQEELKVSADFNQKGSDDSPYFQYGQTPKNNINRQKEVTKLNSNGKAKQCPSGMFKELLDEEQKMKALSLFEQAKNQNGINSNIPLSTRAGDGNHPVITIESAVCEEFNFLQDQGGKDGSKRDIFEFSQQSLYRQLQFQKEQRQATEDAQLEKNLRQLKVGFKAVKYHYSKKKIKDCTLKVTEDMQYLYWVYDDSVLSSKFMRRFCKISDIQSLIYGPQSYTFRAYRLQHLLNCFQEQKKLVSSQTDLEISPSESHVDVIPPTFYGWQCLSLKMPMRTIDFVIHDEEEIMNFLQAMSTLISRKSRYTDSLAHKSSMPISSGGLDTSDPYQQVLQHLEPAKVNSIRIFKIMRAKMKISFHASLKRISVLEHFVITIIESYKALKIQESCSKSMTSLLRSSDQGTDIIAHASLKRRAEQEQQIQPAETNLLAEQNNQQEDEALMERIRGLVTLGTAFQSSLKGLSKLQAIRARLRFQRLKFERYIQTEWQFGMNPCTKIPIELQAALYPQSFRFYDCVPLIFAHYINLKVKKNIMSTTQGVQALSKTLSRSTSTYDTPLTSIMKKVSCLIPISCIQAQEQRQRKQIVKSNIFRQPTIVNEDNMLKTKEEVKDAAESLGQRIMQFKIQQKRRSSQRIRDNIDVITPKSKEKHKRTPKKEDSNFSGQRALLLTKKVSKEQDSSPLPEIPEIKQDNDREGGSEGSNFSRQASPEEQQPAHKEFMSSQSPQQQNQNSPPNQPQPGSIQRKKPRQLQKATDVVKVYSDVLNYLQRLEDDQYDLGKLATKQLHLKQMMNLKTKGRFLEETKCVDQELKILPSTKSQKKVQQQLDYQNEDAQMELLDIIRRAKTLEKKNRIVTQLLHQEYFFFNPAYTSLLNKRTEILANQVGDGMAQQRADQFCMNLPSLQQKVRYKSNRDHQQRRDNITHYYVRTVFLD
ncbi:hypothetical protein FGO68_gene6336 [Halteria grandinella]|uniref:Uncharacterized protein n=1 Tax=Halteria grandinella TaxID=5974 RepID=A0A8J8P6I5_HALGN|nr:hypothetical protein FGO68_gene6336 [Halteria grandinella]